MDYWKRRISVGEKSGSRHEKRWDIRASPRLGPTPDTDSYDALMFGPKKGYLS